MNENTSPAIGDGSKELLLFQMGPVQEFIAQAATPSDLWAGSYLLSDLILAGIKIVPDYKENLVFPKPYAWAGAPTGQVLAQAPHSMQVSGSISYLPSPSEIALTGHAAAQAPHAMHSSEI